MRLFVRGSLIGAIAMGSAALLAAQHSAGGHAGTMSSPHAGGSYTGINTGALSHFHGSSYQALPPRLPAPIGLQPPTAGFTGINPGALNPSRGYYPGGYSASYAGSIGGQANRERRNGNRNVRVGGYVALPYYPFFGYDSYANSPYDSYYGSAPYDSGYDQTAQTTANLLGEQIQRLSAEVEELRNSPQGQLDPPALAQNDPAPAATPLTLILRDGRQLQVQSYAVMDGTLWDFSRPSPRRIPLASIDIAASAKATQDAGGEFPDLGNVR